MTNAHQVSTPISLSHQDLISVQLIYAGGTFGSHGKPLSTLPAPTFTPLLLKLMRQRISQQVDILDNTAVKDSSHFTPEDFVHFFKLILSKYSQCYKQFIIITGTDTLSYLGAFLAEAFAGSDICIVLTGSMKPLFNANDIHDYTIDEHSDAWVNLKDALGIATYGEAGVHIAFAGEVWPAQTVQKIHSHDLMAFTGHNRAGYPANSYLKSLPDTRRQHWISDKKTKLPDIVLTAKTAIIPTIYCVPNNPDWFVTQLETLAKLPATGIILIGFGAGNLPYNDRIAKTMDTLYKKGHILVTTTQCPYGGVSDAYAAGSWQYEHHVFSAGRLTIPAIYARLLWLHLAYDTPTRRRQRWTYSISKTNIGLSK